MKNSASYIQSLISLPKILFALTDLRIPEITLGHLGSPQVVLLLHPLTCTIQLMVVKEH